MPSLFPSPVGRSSLKNSPYIGHWWLTPSKQPHHCHQLLIATWRSMLFQGTWPNPLRSPTCWVGGTDVACYSAQALWWAGGVLLLHSLSWAGLVYLNLRGGAFSLLLFSAGLTHSVLYQRVLSDSKIPGPPLVGNGFGLGLRVKVSHPYLEADSLSWCP